VSGAALRSLLDSTALVAAPGALDPFTARIIESLGFPAVYLGGHSMGIHLCVGQPFVTMTETIDIASGLMRAISVPLIVDLGTGFGNATHIHRTVWECERAGIAAIHIDDQPFPKRASYHRGKGTIVPVEEAVTRLEAAVDARSTSDLLLIARTDSWRVTGSVDDVIARCHAYAATGIDLLMILDLEPAALVPIADQLPPLPLVWIGATSGPGPSLDELGGAGFKLAVFPFNTAAAVLDAVTDTWRHLRDDGRLAQTPDLLNTAKGDVLDLIGMPDYWKIEDTLTPEGS
jgi:2-methylisocitrate lyase-like PEP mutase family enzyme